MSPIASTPQVPYWAVTFTSIRSKSSVEQYLQIAKKMEEFASELPGYLGLESARDPSGEGITITYWKDREASLRWKNHAEHKIAQHLGREKFYKSYKVRICEVSADYEFTL